MKKLPSSNIKEVTKPKQEISGQASELSMLASSLDSRSPIRNRASKNQNSNDPPVRGTSSPGTVSMISQVAVSRQSKVSVASKKHSAMDPLNEDIEEDLRRSSSKKRPSTGFYATALNQVYYSQTQPVPTKESSPPKQNAEELSQKSLKVKKIKKQGSKLRMRTVSFDIGAQLVPFKKAFPDVTQFVKKKHSTPAIDKILPSMGVIAQMKKELSSKESIQVKTRGRSTQSKKVNRRSKKMSVNSSSKDRLESDLKQKRKASLGAAAEEYTAITPIKKVIRTAKKKSRSPTREEGLRMIKELQESEFTATLQKSSSKHLGIPSPEAAGKSRLKRKPKIASLGIGAEGEESSIRDEVLSPPVPLQVVVESMSVVENIDQQLEEEKEEVIPAQPPQASLMHKPFDLPEAVPQHQFLTEQTSLLYQLPQATETSKQMNSEMLLQPLQASAEQFKLELAPSLMNKQAKENPAELQRPQQLQQVASSAQIVQYATEQQTPIVFQPTPIFGSVAVPFTPKPRIEADVISYPSQPIHSAKSQGRTKMILKSLNSLRDERDKMKQEKKSARLLIDEPKIHSVAASSDEDIETGEEKPQINGIPNFLMSSPSTGRLHVGPPRNEGVYHSVQGSSTRPRTSQGQAHLTGPKSKQMMGNHPGMSPSHTKLTKSPMLGGPSPSHKATLQTQSRHGKPTGQTTGIAWPSQPQKVSNSIGGPLHSLDLKEQGNTLRIPSLPLNQSSPTKPGGAIRMVAPSNFPTRIRGQKNSIQEENIPETKRSEQENQQSARHFVHQNYYTSSNFGNRNQDTTLNFSPVGQTPGADAATFGVEGDPYGSKQPVSFYNEQQFQGGHLGGDMQPPTTDDEEEQAIFQEVGTGAEDEEPHNISGYEGDNDRGIMSSNKTKFQKRKSLRESKQSHPITSQFRDKQSAPHQKHQLSKIGQATQNAYMAAKQKQMPKQAEAIQAKKEVRTITLDQFPFSPISNSIVEEDQINLPPAQQPTAPAKGSQQPIVEDSWNKLHRYLNNLSPEDRHLKELESATFIQKWVRGHLIRMELKKQKEVNFKHMRKLRRFLSVAYGKTRTRLIKQAIRMLREASNLQQDQNYRLWQKYKGHCATLIQKTWKGYALRFIKLNEYNKKVWDHKRSRLMNAMVKGYKTRMLLNGSHAGIYQIKQDIVQVLRGKTMIIDVNDRMTMKNLMKRRRQKVMELIRLFTRSFATPGIIVSLIKSKKQVYRHGKKRQQSNRQVNPFHFEQEEQEDETEPQYSEPVSKRPDLRKRKTWASPPREEKQEPGVAWPSSITAKDHSHEEEEDDQQQKPSAFASFWPSQQPPPEDPVPAADEPAEEEEQEGEIDWLAIPVKKSPKSSGKKKSKVTAPIVNLDQAPLDLDDRPINPAAAKAYDDLPVGVHNKQTNPTNLLLMAEEEARQIQLERERQHELELQREREEAALRSPPAKDDVIPAMKDSSSGGKQPTNYDFEKMIEDALKKHGEKPAVGAMPDDQPKRQPMGAGAGPPVVADKFEGDQPANDENMSGGGMTGRGGEEKQKRKPKKVDPKKKELLDKRKKYDPRAAIKNQKKQVAVVVTGVDSQTTGGNDGDVSSRRDRFRSKSRSRMESPAHVNSARDNRDNSQKRPAQFDDKLSNNACEKEESENPEGAEGTTPRPPRPYLKRKTKTSKVEKGSFKPQGKSKIDCWQRDGSGPQQTTKMGAGPQIMKRLQPQNQKQKPLYPFRRNDEPAVGGVFDQDNEYSDANFLNTEIAEINNNFSPPAQDTRMKWQPPSQAPAASADFFSTQSASEQLSNPSKMGIDELENVFNFLHGPAMGKTEKQPNQPKLDRLQQMGTSVNSHEFKFSMIPFSEFNNSEVDNLYKAQSKIPFLFKDHIGGVTGTKFSPVPKSSKPSLFFQCYCDDIYDAILEDLRNHYIEISNQDQDDDDEEDAEVGRESQDGGLLR